MRKTRPTPPFVSALLPALVIAMHISSAQAEVVINELMYHPLHADNTVEPTEEEFIELHNTDPTSAVNLSGWSFTNGITFTFPAVSIPPSGFLVIAADPATFAAKHPAVTSTVVGPWIGRLGNDGERVRLVNAAQIEIDDLRYTDDGEWATRRRGPLDNGHRGWTWDTPADRGGSSLELINPKMTNKRGQNWAASSTPEGTPGAANSISATNTAPFLTDVSHAPAIPSSADLVRIRAKLADETSTGLSATVHYRISSASPAPFTSLTMDDDGLNDDELPNDGIFAATLPAHADGTVVEFYVEASDGVGARTWPAPTDETGTQGANALYAVEDNPLANAREVYRIVLSAPEEDEFSFGSFDQDSNAQMNATFIATRGSDQEVRYRAGLRRRGNGSRKENPRTMRLNLPGDTPWDDITSLNLNSRTGYLQIFGHEIIAASCLPGGRGRSVKLLINGDDEATTSSRMFGFYAHMEPQNSLSIERQFPDDPKGNLYRKRSSTSDLAYRSGDVQDYLDDNWSKETNNSDWDWSDLDSLLGTLNDTTNPDYYDNISTQVDVEQWLRWFAVMALLNNDETNISTGRDDDYYLYRGNLDPRFKLVPHDLDTILSEGDNSPTHTIFDMFESGDTIPILKDFIEHPQILPRYYHHLRDLIETTFAKEFFDSLLHDSLSFVPASERSSLITHMDQRRAHVLSLIDPPLSVQSALPVTGDFPYTTSASLELDGSYNLIDTASVLVNGAAATLDPVDGTWTHGPVADALLPGINRIFVQALDGENNEVASRFIEIWHDDGDIQTLSGTLTSNTSLTAAAGPYLVTADLTVPAGITLDIGPGTSVYFASGTRLNVQGTLLAEGSLFLPIQFTRNPASPASWDGVSFSNSGNDSRMIHLDQSFSTAASHSLGITNSRLTLESVRWTDTTETVIEASHPQLIVRNCEFPPTSGNEVIHGSNLTGSDYFHLDGCFFNSSSGYNDIIDFSGGRRPGPIIYVTNCIFNGGTDDCLDLDGIDAHVEGNIFRNIHTDDPSRSSTSNAIATDGDAHITIVRNLFDNVDHALLLKNEADATFENNVVTGATLGAISFREPLRSDVDAGSHVDVRGNIFIDNAVTFRFPDHLRDTGTPPVITADFNILPAADHIYGTGNLDADPVFLDATGGDFRLSTTSPARGAGINGSDSGADVPRGALLTGTPPTVTASGDATLQVHIAGISGIQSGSFVSEYRWRLDGGTWSTDTPITTPIALVGLSDGTHTVEAIAKDSAGFWQAEADAASVSWTVDAAHSVLRINEVLADNQTAWSNGGTFPDYIELINDGTTPVVLTGMRLTDDPLLPAKFTFPATTLNGGERLLLLADSETGAPGTHLGFSLDSEGDSVVLFAPDGVTVLDTITFGPQVADCSIGRIGPDAAWALNVPTPDAANQRKGTGDPGRLVINEWLAGSSLRICDDFVELYNPGTSPVALGGLFFTDDPGIDKAEYEIPALSFIAAGGFETFWADGTPSRGADHLSFKLNANAEWIGLYSADLEMIDLVAFSAQATDVSAGRFPDGGSSIIYSALPTPGISNAQTGAPTVVVESLVALEATWSYEQSDTDLLTAWRAPGYDDSLWPTGQALLYVESSALPGPKNTPLTLGASTYYFRTSFEFTGDPAAAQLSLQSVIDDGVVIYLNGEELHRLGIDDPYDHDSDADRTVSDAGLEGPFAVPNDHLVNGTNVIAAEVHQTNSTSSDIVFGLVLDATITTPGTPTPEFENAITLIDGLRITEIMFHPIEGSDYEFIELQNISSEILDLTGVRFSDGIDFVFPAMTLAPGEFVVLVSNQTAFVAKYGSGYPVAGEYTGQLSNGGEDLVLQLPAPFDANIQKFTYDDAWFPLADGPGHSLEFVDPSARIAGWSSPSSWRLGAFDGTPGGAVSLSAGSDNLITLPGEASLSGSFSGTWTPSMQWSKFSGPGAVAFSAPSAANSTASFSLPGTYVLRLLGEDGAVMHTSAVVVTVDDTYDAWRSRLGVAGGPLDNDDGDELLNQEEYAFERDPHAAESEGSPSPGKDNGLIAVEFHHYPRKSDLQINLAASLDLLSWAPATPEFVSGTPDLELLRYEVDPDSVPHSFFRFEVTTLP